MSLDREQLSTEFIAQRHSLNAFIFGMVRDSSVADDIFQDVWIQFTRALDKGVEIEHLDRWCRGVARNRILQYWRSARRDKILVNSNLLELVEVAFEESREEKERLADNKHALRKCIENLPEKSGKIIRMKYQKNLDMKTIGEKVGKTADAVKMLVCRIRKSLRKCIETRLEEAGL